MPALNFDDWVADLSTTVRARLAAELVDSWEVLKGLTPEELRSIKIPVGALARLRKQKILTKRDRADPDDDSDGELQLVLATNKELNALSELFPSYWKTDQAFRNQLGATMDKWIALGSSNAIAMQHLNREMNNLISSVIALKKDLAERVDEPTWPESVAILWKGIVSFYLRCKYWGETATCIEKTLDSVLTQTKTFKSTSLGAWMRIVDLAGAKLSLLQKEEQAKKNKGSKQSVQSRATSQEKQGPAPTTPGTEKKKKKKFIFKPRR